MLQAPEAAPLQAMGEGERHTLIIRYRGED